jgi:phenylacetate-CoA ligase
MRAEDRKQLSGRITEMAEIETKVGLLLDSDGWSRERLSEWQREREVAAIEAARRSPFWSDRVAGATELAAIEPLDRSSLRDGTGRIRVPDARPTISYRTSGSSGEPVEVEHGAEQIGFAAAARLRQLSWFGLPPRHLPTANVWAAAGASDPVIRRVNREPAEFHLNHWELDEDSVAEVAGRLLDAGGVRLIGGSTSMLAHWAELWLEQGLDDLDVGIDLAIVGAEMTYEEQRRLIARAFRCRVAEMYGSWEAQMIACECPSGSLHVNEEVVRLEILRPDGSAAAPGEYGDVAVTLLHNPEFPLLRYLVGDVAAWAPGACACGRPHTALDLDLGRSEDMISCGDGRRLHPRVIRSTYERELGPRLRAFHTVQDAPGRFRAMLSVEGELPGHLGAAVEAELGVCMNEAVTVEVVAAEPQSLERQRGGKLRTFSNRVEPARR